MPKLSLNPSVLLSPTTEGYIAYDTVENLLHEFNPTAALLVELCNGTRTGEEVVELAAPMLPPDSESAVLEWLAQAIDAGVIVEESEAHEKREVQELSVDELTDLASQLRDEGKVQAAFLCQQRASELEPAVASILRNLGELAHIVGKREAARQAYENYLAQEPGDAEIQHLLTSLRDDTPPSRVPDECIRQLYERFSGFYEDNMCDELGYEGPLHLGDVIEQTLGERTDLSILDLGCGTGLAGLAVADRASHIVGVDLSPEMIEQARNRNLYDELYVAEAATWLAEAQGEFDLIIACDTLIYFGDLSQVIAPAKKLLRHGGVIAFSVESANSGTFSLTDNGRYVHHLDHIHSVAQNVSLKVVQKKEAFLRMEYGQEVTAMYVALQG